jgi:hypothetical protein
MTKAYQLIQIILQARFYRINPDSYLRNGTGYMAIEKLIITT